jgi:hypothetical protein
MMRDHTREEVTILFTEFIEQHKFSNISLATIRELVVAELLRRRTESATTDVADAAKKGFNE